MDDKTAEFRRKFEMKLTKILSKKAINAVYLSKEKYSELLEEIPMLRHKFKGKTSSEYRTLKRYEVIETNEGPKLVCPYKEEGQIRFYVTNDEIFDILHETHLKIGHGGRNRMLKEIKKKYKNITIESIMLYIVLCETCRKRVKSVKKDEEASKVFVSNYLGNRGLVDLFDMRERSDEDYKFILVYQDVATRFVQLRALRSDDPDEIANTLVDIFTIIGVPSILQSHKGREFASKIIEKVCELWPELSIVHGENVRVEQDLQSIKNILEAWLTAHDTTQWAKGLKFIQFIKNRAHDSILKQCPFKAMFGQPVRVGLKSCDLPEDVIKNLKTEEELKEFLEARENREESEEDDVDDNDSVMCIDEIDFE